MEENLSHDLHEISRKLTERWVADAQARDERLEDRIIARMAAMMVDRQQDQVQVQAQADPAVDQVLRQGPAMVNTRLSKVDFPHFWGVDLDGWLFIWDSLFEMKRTPEDPKIQIATLHLEGPALHGHKRFMRDFPGCANMTWTQYCEHLSRRFAAHHETPSEELKNLK